MAQQTIGVGSSANDGTGDPLRTAFNKINANFSELYGDTAEANDILKSVKDNFEESGFIEFYPGVSYRHLLVLRGATHSDRVLCTPPHNAINRKINSILVKAVDNFGKFTAGLLNKTIMNSYKLLKNHPVNLARVKSGKNPANIIWPWGQGRRPHIRTLEESFGAI